MIIFAVCSFAENRLESLKQSWSESHEAKVNQVRQSGLTSRSASGCCTMTHRYIISFCQEISYHTFSVLGYLAQQGFGQTGLGISSRQTGTVLATDLSWWWKYLSSLYTFVRDVPQNVIRTTINVFKFCLQWKYDSSCCRSFLFNQIPPVRDENTQITIISLNRQNWFLKYFRCKF